MTERVSDRITAAVERESIEVPFGANEIRLDWRQWGMVAVLVGAVIWCLPGLWSRWERVPFAQDFRVPYAYSKDYWLYRHWLQHADSNADSNAAVYVVGDSVVWGEYVSAGDTLPAFLNAQRIPTDESTVFVNAGVNGLFPLALEGLVQHYGDVMRERRVLLHCNLLWMTSPEADLSATKEQVFNHPRLVPQFWPEIPGYRAPFDDRLGILIERNVPFLGWVTHLQNVYFDQKSLYQWTLADDGDYPPSYPNTYRLPWEAISFQVEAEPESDPDRGRASSRHRPWSTTGEGSQEFEWVSLSDSLQWGAFQRMIDLILSRGNELLVVIGPLNRHIMSSQNQLVFDERLAEALAYFRGEGIRVVVPDVLPFDMYGDASHPLTEGYRRLAGELWDNEVFQTWLTERRE